MWKMVHFDVGKFSTIIPRSACSMLECIMPARLPEGAERRCRSQHVQVANGLFIRWWDRLYQFNRS